MNGDLIRMMSKCDGTNKNCKGCMFREHPECRNAMARHAAAVLNLSDVMFENSRMISSAAIAKREEAMETMEAQAVALEMYEEMCGKIALELSEAKHCPTCLHNPPDDLEMSEICKKCQAGDSEWLLAERLQPRRRSAGAEDDGEKSADEAPVTGED